MKHFTKVTDFNKDTALSIIKRAKAMKSPVYHGKILDGKVIALIFEKSSTRTRISFEVGIRQLGGQTIFMTPAESQLGRSEPLRDTARVLSRYCHGLVIRTFGQEKIDEFVNYANIPVVNALTDQGHPCQIMSDLLTIYERTPDFSALRVAWVGDGNNMANSWIEAATLFPLELTLACPEDYTPEKDFMDKAIQAGAKIKLYHDPREAIKGAHYVNTDVWASMGQENEQTAREKAFAGYQIDSDMLRLAAPDAKFMHCLPAHRGEEVSEEVLEGPASIIFDQAENRLHAQKAILEWLYS